MYILKNFTNTSGEINELKQATELKWYKHIVLWKHVISLYIAYKAGKKLQWCIETYIRLYVCQTVYFYFYFLSIQLNNCEQMMSSQQAVNNKVPKDII